jgi:hypothetical protein
VTDERMYVSGPVWRNSDEPTGSTIQVVDISDPSGDLVLGDSVEVAGQVNSRWQMDEYEGVLRVLSQPFEWDLSVPPTLETFEVESSDALSPLGSVELQLPRAEQLQSVRFDGERAYAITFEQTDPLFTLDLSDPAAPVQAGILEMPGWLYHMEPRGDRLLGLGFDQGNEDGALTVSIFDVSDLSQPTMLDRANFGGEWGWMVEDQDRIHKAFRLLEDASLILMPFSGWTQPEGQVDDYCYGSWVSGIQLIDWQGDELETRGIAETRGDARRGLLHRDRLLAVSDERVESFDISDRDAPESTSHAVLAQYVSRTLGVGDSALRISQNWYTNELSVDMVAVDDAGEPGAPNELDIDLNVAECSGSYLQEAFASDDRVHFLIETYDYSGDKGLQNRLVTVDASDPDEPKVVGDATIDVELYYGYDEFVPGATRSAVMAGDALVLGNYDGEWTDDGTRHIEGGIYVVDPTDPEAPETTYLALPPGDGASGLLTDGSIVARSHFEVSDEDAADGRFYLDRIDVSDPRKPQLLPSVNVPGAVVALAGNRALTVDFRYVVRQDVTQEKCWQNHARVVSFDGPDNAVWDETPGTCTALAETLRLVELDGSQARLLGSERIDAKHLVSGVALGDGVAFVSLSTGDSYFWGDGLVDCYGCFYYGNSTMDLVTVGGLGGGDFEAGRVELAQGNEYYYGGKLAAGGHRAIVSSGWHGTLSVIDASDASAPEVAREVAVYGYVQDLRVIGNTAVASMGYDGVQTIDLGD